MPRPTVALPALLSLAATCSLVACSDAPTRPRPRVPAAVLEPRPFNPPAEPAPDSLAAPTHPSAIAILGLPASDTITVGASMPLSVRALDTAGVDLTDLPTRWLVSDTTVATVDSLSGVLLAAKRGQVQVGVTVSDTTAWVGVTVIDTVVAPAPAPPPPAPPTPPAGPVSPSSVVLQVVRFDGQSGPITVSAGVPLIAGALQAGQEGSVHVIVGEVEQPAYVAGLLSRHPDGSLRAVLVQVQLASLDAGQALPARLEIGAPRAPEMTLGAPLVAPESVQPSTPKGLPAAALLPTDPSYLIATDLVGPTVAAAQTQALGGAFARYESDFARFADHYWATEGVDYLQSDYYDRALIYYAMWARTGNPTYWARAGQIAYDYRARYLEPNAYGSSPHWAQLEGLEKHYLLTGDDASRAAVLKTAYVLQLGFLNNGYMTGSAGESRIAARVLHSQLLAWRLAPPVAASLTFRGANMTAVNWGRNVETAISKLAAWQQADGSYPANAVCGGQLNYMVGQLNDALVKTYDYYVPTTTSRTTLQGTIQTLVRKAVDYLWTTQWVASKNAFQYASVDCSSKGVGGPTAAPDLNNMLTAGFGWVYRSTGDPQYLAAGEAIFASGVTQAYLSGTKQFNENYTSSFRYLGYR